MDDDLSTSLHEMLAMLARHGVAVRVLPVEELRLLTLGTVDRIHRWFMYPQRFPQPPEIQRASAPVAQLVKKRK